MGAKWKTCNVPVATATVESIEPIDKSSWRITMSSNMPVDIMAIEAVWFNRFHKLRGVMNEPPKIKPSESKPMVENMRE